MPDPADPQSLNRYTYGLNNPLKFREPSGHCVENYQHDSEYLGTCIEGWNLLREYYADTYGYEHYPNDYLNEILMRYDIDTIAGMLSYFGVECDYSLPDRAPITEPPGSNQECYQHQGMLVCSPEGGWPKYYPWTVDDTAWLMERGTNALISFGTGQLIVAPIVKQYVRGELARRIIGYIVNKTIATPAARATIDYVRENRNVGALNVNLELTINNPAPENYTMDRNQWRSQSSTHSGWHPPLIYPE